MRIHSDAMQAKKNMARRYLFNAAKRFSASYDIDTIRAHRILVDALFKGAKGAKKAANPKHWRI